MLFTSTLLGLLAASRLHGGLDARRAPTRPSPRPASTGSTSGQPIAVPPDSSGTPRPYRSAEPEPGSDESATELLDLGKQEVASGEYEQAVQHLQDASEKAPGNTEIANLLKVAKQKAAADDVKTGRRLLLERKYDDAALAFRNALDLVPELEIAKRGEALAKRWPAAENYCKTAKERLDVGDIDGAIADYEKAYALTKDASVGKWLAEARAARGKELKEQS